MSTDDGSQPPGDPFTPVKATAELKYLVQRMARVLDDVQTCAATSPASRVDGATDVPPADEATRTRTEIEQFPVDIAVALRRVWSLCGDIRAPRKRTCRGLYDTVVAGRVPSASTVTEAEFAHLLSFYTRRYFKSIRALERSLDVGAYAEYHRNRKVPDGAARPTRPVWREKIVPFLGSDADGSDDEVVEFIKMTLQRTCTIDGASETVRVESVPESFEEIKVDEVSVGGHGSAAGSATRRSRVLSNRGLHSLPSMQSVRPALTQRKRPLPPHSVSKPSMAAVTEEHRIDMSDEAARAMCLRHDVQFAESMIDNRLVTLRSQLLAAMDGLRQYGDLLTSYALLERHLQSECDHLENHVIPSKRNVLRLLQVATAIAVSNPELLHPEPQETAS